MKLVTWNAEDEMTTIATRMAVPKVDPSANDSYVCYVMVWDADQEGDKWVLRDITHQQPPDFEVVKQCHHELAEQVSWLVVAYLSGCGCLAAIFQSIREGFLYASCQVFFDADGKHCCWSPDNNRYALVFGGIIC